MSFLRVHYPFFFVFVFLVVFVGCAKRKPGRPTPQMDAPEQFWVRVLLVDNATDCTLQVPAGYSVINARQKNTETHFNPSPSPLKITASQDGIAVGPRLFNSEEVVILPDEPYIFRLNGQPYRGKLKLVTNVEDSSFDAINVVPLEPYLAGVVGAEMPNYWEPAALQAQAIAARTYGLYIKRRFGSTRSWDVRKSQAHQVYRGVAAESVQVWSAINKTSGKVLVCRRADGTKGIFPAFYSSVCGGHTEGSKSVFGEAFEALVGRPCPYCKDTAKLNFYFWPEVQIEKETVTSKLIQRYPKLNKLGEIKDIIAARKSDYKDFSRLTLLKLVGSTGKSDFLRAEDFRLSIDPTGRSIRSTSCKIVQTADNWAFTSGRGYGHGVGMCQCGAQAMARKGKTAGEILFYYYQGSKIKSVY